MASHKYGSSSVTWSLPVRILLSLLTLIPVWLLITALISIDRQEIGGAMQLAIAGTSLCLVPRYLAAVWSPNPKWQVSERQQRILESRLADSLAKQAAPPPANNSEPTHITRRHW